MMSTGIPSDLDLLNDLPWTSVDGALEGEDERMRDMLLDYWIEQWEQESRKDLLELVAVWATDGTVGLKQMSHDQLAREIVDLLVEVAIDQEQESKQQD